MRRFLLGEWRRGYLCLVCPGWAEKCDIGSVGLWLIQGCQDISGVGGSGGEQGLVDTGAECLVIAGNEQLGLP